MNLPAAPLGGYLAEMSESPEEVAKRIGSHPRTVCRWISGECKTITLETADRVFINMGRPDLLASLYPSDGREDG